MITQVDSVQCDTLHADVLKSFDMKFTASSEASFKSTERRKSKIQISKTWTIMVGRQVIREA